MLLWYYIKSIWPQINYWRDPSEVHDCTFWEKKAHHEHVTYFNPGGLLARANEILEKSCISACTQFNNDLVPDTNCTSWPHTRSRMYKLSCKDVKKSQMKVFLVNTNTENSIKNNINQKQAKIRWDCELTFVLQNLDHAIRSFTAEHDHAISSFTAEHPAQFPIN